MEEVVTLTQIRVYPNLMMEKVLMLMLAELPNKLQLKMQQIKHQKLQFLLFMMFLVHKINLLLILVVAKRNLVLQPLLQSK